MSVSAIPAFGDVLRYDEEYYVYLAHTENFVYTAKILNPDLTIKLIALDDKRAQKTDAFKTDGHKLFAYIILSTENFNKRAAHLNDSQQDEGKMPDFDWIGCAINNNDKIALKNEILRDGSPVAKELKKIFQNMAE